MSDAPTPETVGRNRLAEATSPYLLQHAGNPVDWYPWGEEAFRRARLLDRPIFLSVGYAACHWCHVMAHESFEDPLVAADINRDFVAIKVDREERPDVDAVYMAAVQAMTGQGGWPMSVFLTPDGRPFYGGTYFPPVPTHGLPAFRQVLAAVTAGWASQRAEIETSAVRIAEAVAAANRPRSTPLEAAAPGRASGLVGLDGRALQAVRPPAPASLDGQVLEAAGATIRRDFDANTGGWGGAPKFPQPLAVEFLLREAAAGDDDALAVASRHLLAMAAGGIHDLVGGGFARYATDARWLVPHFEKMLYDNAQIARACLHAWQLGGNERLRELAGESLAFLLETMTNDAGAFIASLDADTDGVEGATYTWTVTEIEAALAPLGPEVWPLAAAAWGVTPEGNWEGRTILHEARDPRDLALAFGLPEDGIRSRLGAAKARVLEVRRERPQPGRDDKIVAAWNGLALSALSEAAAALDRPDFAAAAVRCAAFLVDALVDEHGLLHRTWRDGRVGPVATLEDHAALAEGLLCLYELTFDERWFVEARRLMDRVRHHFADPAGGWFDTSDDGERLIVRPKAIQDNATPSGNALTSTVLLRLAGLTGDGEERRTAEAALGLVTGHVERYPTAFAAWLVALDLAVRPLTELAIVGRSEDPITAALIGVAREGFRPRMMVAAAPPVSIAGSAVPLLEGRTAREGRAAAYVCREFACRAPVSSPDALRAELALQSGSTARPSR